MNVICFNCKKNTTNPFKTSFGYVCQDCKPTFEKVNQKYKKRTIISCFKCGKKESIYREDVDNFFHHVCEKCKQKDYTTCPSCKEKKHKSGMVYIFYKGKEIKICKECCNLNYEKCNFCNKMFRWEGEELIYAQENPYSFWENEVVVCKECAKDNVFTCNECEMSFINRSGNCINGLCSACHETQGLNEYSYKPKPIFCGEKNSDEDFYVGVELEVEGFEKEKYIEFIKEMKKFDEFLYMKRDGSLSEFGIEIVSHPGTFKFHCQTNIWKDVFILLEKYGMTKNNNCGLHFHVDKKAITKYQYGAFVVDYFVNHNEDFVSEIAGRSFSRYSAKTIRKNNNWGTKNKYSEHYNCINFGNKNTIEFRFCKSTNDYQDFLKKMELIQKIVLFSRCMTNKEILQDESHGLNLFKEKFYK